MADEVVPEKEINEALEHAADVNPEVPVEVNPEAPSNIEVDVTPAPEQTTTTTVETTVETKPREPEAPALVPRVRDMVSAETAHGDDWAARIRAQHEAAGADCPCGNVVAITVDAEDAKDAGLLLSALDALKRFLP